MQDPHTETNIGCPLCEWLNDKNVSFKSAFQEKNIHLNSFTFPC